MTLDTTYRTDFAQVEADQQQVNLDRSATRYCPNMGDHAHFQCEECGRITDFEGTAKPKASGFRVPRGFKVKQVEMSIRGLCRECARKG